MKKYSIFCFLLIAVFYIVEVSVLGYTVYFLGENGYTSSEIGILLAIFGIIAAVLQPILGSIADKFKKIDFKSILTYAGLLGIILFILLYVFHGNKVLVGLLFGLIFIVFSNMSPFVNESCFYYKNAGENVDFGIARSCGSFSFAVFSYILGIGTNVYGSRILSFSGIIGSIVFFLLVLLLPRVDAKDDAASESKIVEAKIADDKHVNFIMKYPSFFLMVLATIFAMCFQNADCGYLIQIIEALGGNASDLGTSNAVAAIVEIPTMFMITRIMKKISVKKLLLIACALYIVRGFVFCINSLSAIFVAQVMQMCTYAILTPTAVYLADEMMDEGDKNKGQTFIGMAVTIGLIAGSFLGGQFVAIGGTNLLKIGCIVIAVLSFVFALLGNLIKS